MRFRQFVVLLLILLSHTAVSARTAPSLINSLAGAPLSAEYVAYREQYTQRILRNFHPTSAQEGVTVLFTINRNGMLSEVCLFGTSCSLAFDLAALESVITVSPLPAAPKDFTRNEFGLPARVDFIPARLPKAHNEQVVKLFVHAIPVDVLVRYPNVLNENEVLGPQNLYFINNSFYINDTGKNTELGSRYRQVTEIDVKTNRIIKTEREVPVVLILRKSLLDYFEEWSLFFSTHPATNKQELFAYRDHLHQKYSMLWEKR
jgi:hypothetical protein